LLPGSAASRYSGKIYRNAYLIYNPNAGKLVRKPGLAQRVRALLEQGGLKVEPAPTSEPGHATVLAAEAVKNGAGLVIAMGGDGTINEVLNGMAHSTVPLAVIPGGTANVFCCETGIPRNAEQAARQLPGWVEARVALGRIQPAAGPARWFLSMAGAGLDAGIVQRVDPGDKRRLGKIAYWIAGLRSFGERLAIIHVSVDGRLLETGFALASRVRNYGGDLTIASRASLFANHFELVTFSGRSTAPYLMYLSGAVVALATSLPGVQSVITTSVTLTPGSSGTVYIQVDGESAGQLPVTIDLAPSALTILVPRGAMR
jgi:diacylglycerol kinase (ATP)